MKIKICGLKTLEDSLAACRAGADLLGFNFYAPSPRYLTPEDCGEIVQMIKVEFSEVVCVGIFVNHALAEIHEIMDQGWLNLAQLSGDEPPETLTVLGERGFKALRPKSASEAKNLIEELPSRSSPPACLIDSYQPGAYGGSGETGDWQLAAQIAEDHPILLAGGLNPENVAGAIQQVRPWGVDVASGVEHSRGEKDPAKINAFIQAARLAAQTQPEIREHNYGRNNHPQ